MIDNVIKEIKQYCELNKLDYDEVYIDILTKGFNIVKYGYKPVILTKEKPKEVVSVQKEKIVQETENKPPYKEIKQQDELYD